MYYIFIIISIEINYISYCCLETYILLSRSRELYIYIDIINEFEKIQRLFKKTNNPEKKFFIFFHFEIK